MPPLALSVTEPPKQKARGPSAVMDAVGNGFTLTVIAEEVAEQPLPSVTVTLKVPEFITVIF